MASLCVLCKPNALLLPPILVLGLLWDRRPRSSRAWKEVAVLAGAAALVLSPWLVRNRLAFGEWRLSWAFDDNLAHVSAVATILEARGEEVAPWTPRWEDAYMREIVAPAAAQYGWTEGGAAPTGREQAKRYQQLASVALRTIRRHPSAFATSHLKGMVRSFVPSAHRNWYSYLTGQPWPVLTSLRSALRAAAAQWAEGNGVAAMRTISAWWSGHPTLARGLWLLSAVSYALGFGLVGAGLYSLRARSGLLLSMGLTLAYLALVPGRSPTSGSGCRACPSQWL